MEQKDAKAPWLIFNIYDDDHRRTLMPWRGFIVNYQRTAEMYHANPWTHLRVNLDSGHWEEVAGPCPTPAALRDLLSFERTRALVAGHEIIQLHAMAEGVPDVPHDRIRRPRARVRGPAAVTQFTSGLGPAIRAWPGQIRPGIVSRFPLIRHDGPVAETRPGTSPTARFPGEPRSPVRRGVDPGIRLTRELLRRSDAQHFPGSVRCSRPHSRTRRSSC